MPLPRALARASAALLAAALVAGAPAPGGDAAQAKKAPERQAGKAEQRQAAQGQRNAGKRQQRQAAQDQRHANKHAEPTQTPGAATPVAPGRGKKAGEPSPAKSKAGNGSGKGAKAKAQPVASPAAPAVVLPTVPAAAAPAPAASPPPDEPGRAERRSGTKPAKKRAARRHPRRGAGAVSGEGAAGGGASVAAPPAPSPAPEAGPAPAGRQEPRRAEPDDGAGSHLAPVTRTVRDLVEVVPEPVKVLLAALGILSLALGGIYALTAARARRLARQRSDLLQEVGLLQKALLPPVPATVGAVRTSVAYRPSDGPAAGGDFYDALTLSGGRAAFILGDVSGHGRQALARTAFMRYTMRAYLEAGLEPRVALQVAGRVVDEHLGGDYATVVLAVHDPQGGSLTYACAGHPAPIVVGPTRPEPVLAASSPPIGLGMRTGVRQTTVPLPPGSVVCLYTDGLAEARTERGVLGRPRLADIVEELGRDATAQDLLDHVAREARLVSDDMATVVLTPTAGVTAGGFRSEQLEIDGAEVSSDLGERFLEACGCSPAEIRDAIAEVERLAAGHGGAVLHVRYGVRGPRVEALPRNVESLQAASLRVAASGA